MSCATAHDGKFSNVVPNGLAMVESNNSVCCAAFGASSDTPEYGTSGTQKSHGMTAKDCAWTYASARLVVSVAPKGYKAPAWPAGTKLKAAAGLGAGAKLATNTRPGTTFIAVTFTKGSHWAEVWVSGGTGSASVLKLSKLVYAKL